MMFAPFLFIYVLFALGFLIALFFLIQMNVIRYALMVLGLPPRGALVALMASLIGSYVNIPLYTVQSGSTPAVGAVSNYGVIYTIPYQYAGDGTTVAINVGGAILPLLIVGYALSRAPAAFLPSALGTVAVAAVTHYFARPMPGLGIALPIFVAPLTAVFVALLLSRTMHLSQVTHVIAYVSGVLGTLIGADLMNLNRIANLGAPVASIGGAGAFDGVFLTGILAVLLAAA
jgi:uncharacterized membrane protein